LLLRADCPSCGHFLKYLPKGELARESQTPNLDKLLPQLGRLALTDHAQELDGWAERQLPRLEKLLEQRDSLRGRMTTDQTSRRGAGGLDHLRRDSRKVAEHKLANFGAMEPAPTRGGRDS